MKDFFPVSLGQKRGYALYLGARYTWQNMSTWSETALRARLSPWARSGGASSTECLAPPACPSVPGVDGRYLIEFLQQPVRWKLSPIIG